MTEQLNWTESSHSLAYEITQPIKTNHGTFHGHQTCSLWWPCGMCFFLNLNKFTSYLLLWLSLNSFCNETSRTWAPLGPETKYCAFWLGLSRSHVDSSPKRGFWWIWVPAHGFKSQSEVKGFSINVFICRHNVVRRSLELIHLPYQTLYSLISKSPFPPSLAPGNHYSIPCCYEFDYSRYLT